MNVFGLTGGVGMGKSTAAELLRQRGLPVVSSDQLAHQLVEPGQPALVEIQAAFGQDIVDQEGRLRRGALARLVFADATARQRLEAIMHPRIRQAWLRLVEAWARQGQTAAVVDIPLLFETRAETHFQATICVACSVATQRARLRARGWTAQQSEQRIQAQLPTAEKMARADYVVWTEFSLAVHAEQLDRLLAAWDHTAPRLFSG